LSNLPNETQVMDSNSYYPRTKALVFKEAKAHYVVTKRIVDFTGALAGMLILLPVFVIVSVLIKLEDPKGSIFFYQQRVGKGEQVFRMYISDRTKVSNAEQLLESLLVKNEIQGHMFKMKEDPRIRR